MARFLVYFVTAIAPFLASGIKGQDTDSSSPSFDDNIPITASSTNTVYSGNSPSLRVIDSGYEMWVVADHSKDRSVSHRESRQLWKFKCADREASLASWVTYSSSGAILTRGNVDQYSLQYEPVVPGSISDHLMKFACKYGPLKLEQ